MTSLFECVVCFKSSQHVLCPTLTKGSKWQITQIWNIYAFRLELEASSTSWPSFYIKSRHHALHCSDRHILLIYEKYHFRHLLPFAKVGQYCIKGWYHRLSKCGGKQKVIVTQFLAEMIFFFLKKSHVYLVRDLFPCNSISGQNAKWYHCNAMTDTFCLFTRNITFVTCFLLPKYGSIV